jgi:hypothetical protein
MVLCDKHNVIMLAHLCVLQEAAPPGAVTTHGQDMRAISESVVFVMMEKLEIILGEDKNSHLQCTYGHVYIFQGT